jgi:myo-inositol-1(or 4)-monophosphatase
MRGRGSFKNGAKISVSERAKLEESLLATGFFTENQPVLMEQLKIFSRLVPQARGVRRAGAAAYDLCMVAEGVFDAFWEKNLKPWDTAAGSLLVEEAGGEVSTYAGEEFGIFKDSLLASNSKLHTLIQHQIIEACRK